MFTLKPCLRLSGLLAFVVLVGCGEPSLDDPEYGQIIYGVPNRLNRPIPLPELDADRATASPAPASADPAPADSAPASAAQPADGELPEKNATEAN